ncbi:MAG: 1-deoxy-D-xylulose-5-phosphate reductoisomerase [Isosphaeraceae bacterium]|nr:1-deoxy-D-xylulose-5-phosphate reductoisomerase [Isosphaeraceae bacterium]
MPQGVESSPGEHPRAVVVLGSTGSIGKSALSVLEHDGGRRLRAFGLSAHSSWEDLVAQARAFRPRYVALTDPEAAARVNGELRGSGIELLRGLEGIIRMVQAPETDRVLTAIVGAAGLEGTWAALEAGKTIALANKETMVIAGPLVTDLARRRRAAILPVDSEHSAIFQAMQSGAPGEVRRVILTSSGGPFRGQSARALKEVTPEQALRHPTWRMGPKITIDSATLMNKALEVIEARWLFDLAPEQIEVVIHPESIIHSMVEFVDGSVVAQLSPPDMRLPIQYALTYPDRWDCPCPRLDLSQGLALHFEPPDRETFPSLDLGFEVMRRGGTAGAALNAANEAAVARFLDGQIGFLDIPRACRAALDHHPFDPRPSLDTLWKVDAWARQEVARWKPI